MLRRVENPMSDLALPMEAYVSADQLKSMLSLYDLGLYLQAYRQAEQVGPLANWRGTDARILAGRLAGNLGSQRMADWHFVHAYRKDRTHPEALWYFTRYLMGARGPLAAWKFVQGQSFPTNARRELQSHWYSQQAAILGMLRDFDAAEELLRKAEEIGTEPWTCLEWAALYSLEDRHEDAEEAARRALKLRPWYRPAVQWVAHFLVQKERDEEALQLLTEATQKLESGSVFGQLAVLQIELKRFAEASHSLDGFERLSPLLDKNQTYWLNARRCDLACHLGEYDKAIEFAKKVKGKFYEGLATRLANRITPGPRVELGVGYVRQHHKTCAPATLTSIAKFWSMPAEHVEVAEEISYIGTQHHNERKWANDHDWYTKSFTVTWEAAVALLDRGIPFTLATTEVSSAHLQAVIGYDAARGTLIIRDPGERHRVEMAFDLVLERYKASGPRGMAMVPNRDKAKLEGVPLPDEALYDLLHRFDLALDAHRREEAGLLMRKMRTEYPGHFLTLYAKRILAWYDGDTPEALKITEEYLKLFPDDLRLQLDRAEYLRFLGGREERLEILKRLSEQKETDPACWQLYAQELSADARRDTETLYLVRKAIRKTPAMSPLQGRLLDTLARIRWDQRRFDEALQLHHFAVCLEDKDEFLAQGYFTAARARGETERVLRLLQKRFQRFGAKSSQSARTLYQAFVQLERMSEAFEVLDEAMRLRPKDGELLTYAAEAHMYKGEFDVAEDILEKAKGVSRPSARLRTSAYLAYNRGDPLRARELWGELIQIEPLAEDAHRQYATYLAERDGRNAAIEHLTTMCKRFPHHFGLNRLLYEWTNHNSPAEREPLLKKLIEIHPANAWARTEYALNLADQGRMEEAFPQLEEAEACAPNAANIWHTKGMLFKKRGQTDDCKYALREAIRLSVDSTFSIQELMWQCENLQERRESLAFVEKELIRQSTMGAGVLALRDACFATMPPNELLASLRRTYDARQDLWYAWSAVSRQLVYMERGDDALLQAQKAVRRFPLLADLWLDLADAHRIKKDLEPETEALNRAVQLAPNYVVALQWLINAHERAGALDLARRAIDQAIARSPLVGWVYLEKADFLWRQNERDQAIQQAKHALKLDPWFDLAWSRLCNWCALLHRSEETVELAKDWTKTRPGESHMWLRLAQAHQWQGPRGKSDEERKRIDACAAAYDQAIERNPYWRDYYDLKAEMLGLAHRYAEARKACNPPVYKGKPPLELRGRLAWVEAQDQDFDAARKQMAALVKEERTYFWGWDQLAAWSFSTREYKEYLDAANDMLRRRPQSAIALTYRGEARLRMDDRDIGLEDLRNAHRKDPCNTLAAYLLFDEQLIDDNLVGAEAALLSLQENLVGDYVRARQVQFACKRDNKELALETFRTMCFNKQTPPQALDMAMRAFDVATWKEPAERVLREAMQEKDWNPHLAMLFSERWNPNMANDLPERIAVLDQALAKQPEAFVFIDMKANLLASGCQFERAWQVCQSNVLPIDQLALDGRAAWIMHRSGQVNEAITKMKELVKENPKYLWGWDQLAAWYGMQRNFVEVLSVAEQLVQLAPRDPLGYAHRGYAKANLGDMQAAKADYVHALDLAPNYLYPAWELFNIYLRAADWRKAEGILEKAKKHADKAEWARAKVDLLVYQNKKANFAEEFESLLRHSEKTPWQVEYSLQVLVQAGWWGDAEEVMHKCLDLGPHICDPWVRLRVAMGDRRVGADIQNMSSRRPERTNCVAAYAIELAYSKDISGLNDWVDRNEEELHADTVCWAKVGGAFYIAQSWQGVIDWMSDWSDHHKAMPGQLIPLIKAMRSLGQVDEARRVGLHALTKLNPDYANSFHKVWLMFDQALEGDVMPVQKYLDTSDLGGFDGYHQLIAGMVRALWLTTTNKESGFEQARPILADAATYAQPTVHDPALKNSYQLCVSQMAALRGTFGAKLWRMWRWLFPILPPVPQPPPQQ
jgi:tetratricopeptide (TPR) repeat protein